MNLKIKEKKVLYASILITACFFIFTPTVKSVHAMDVTADSCSRDDIQSAVDQVVNGGGGAVYIPAGDCSWGDVKPVYPTGNVHIVGAGKDSTIIRLTNKHYNGVIYYNYGDEYTPTDYARISGIKFIADVNTSIIHFRQTTAFRVDNCHFEGNGQINGPIEWKSATKGLIHDNIFINPNDPVAGSYYGITAGSTYAGGIPSDESVCTCWVGDKDAGANPGNSSVSSGMTVIQSEPAVIDNTGGSGQGTVRRIYLQIESVGSNPSVTVASFSRSGNTFTARGRAVNLPVSVGKNIFFSDDDDFTPFAIHNGDYIGVYLNDCTVDATSGSSGWTASGDQTLSSGEDFGSPDVGNVHIAAELFDNEGDLQAYEKSWDDWYDDVSDQRVSYDEFRENIDPASDSAVYIEDNTWDWHKTAIAANWGNSGRFVVRHNTFRHDTRMVHIGFKPGTSYAIIHDNTFEETGETGGYGIRMRANGLIFNNNFVNLNKSIVSNGLRAYGDHYFPPQARIKELYIWGNDFTNTPCGDTDEDCFGGFNSCSYCALVGVGENGNIHLRAPAQDERLYNFQDNMLVYPHPWLTNPPDGDPNPHPDPGSDPDPDPDPGTEPDTGSETGASSGCFVVAIQ